MASSPVPEPWVGKGILVLWTKMAVQSIEIRIQNRLEIIQ